MRLTPPNLLIGKSKDSDKNISLNSNGLMLVVAIETMWLGPCSVKLSTNIQE